MGFINQLITGGPHIADEYVDCFIFHKIMKEYLPVKNFQVGKEILKYF